MVGRTNIGTTPAPSGFTTTATEAVPLLARASMASAVRVMLVSFDTDGGVHVACHGALLNRANSVPLALKTTALTPSASLAWARTNTGTAARTVALAAGVSSETVGAVVSGRMLSVTGDAKPGVPTESMASAVRVSVLPPALVGTW